MKALSIFGLVIGFIGSVLLFFGTPRDTSANVKLGVFAPDSPKGKRTDFWLVVRSYLSKIGFACLSVSFLIQLIVLNIDDN